MKLQLNPVIAILLCAFVVLFPVQAAGATEISAAPPLNPDLNKSFDEEHTMATETSWTCIESQNDDRNEWNNLTNTSLETDDLIRAFTTNTLRVPTDNYSTIQSAVDAAAAGDTVIVESGTYTENVAITTPPLTLRGDGHRQRPSGDRCMREWHHSLHHCRRCDC
ncbi:hypothetical protein [Methanogenium cariaci]|uniref:hypothetical protein n=1 Tax=Methanogenium cariaci TaxID=2197 RepID=UPI000783A72C|nr:hypothetical protein [Methanogenium cariaci]